jgi:DNA-binding transcriptional LysR family regulator
VNYGPQPSSPFSARVIELNGFSAAARAYRVPKVAVSRAIADLEKSMGVQLMKRTTRRIFLTAAGEAVLPHARAIGAEVEKVRQLAQTFSTSREGPLRVIADPNLRTSVAGPAGAAISRQLPGHCARRGTRFRRKR